MKYRKQTQHWRRYRSGRYTLVNKGIKYKHPVTGSITSDQAQKLLWESIKRQQDKRYAYDKATGKYLGEVVKSQFGIEGDYSSPTYFIRGPDGKIEYFNKRIILLSSCKAKNIAECADKRWREWDKKKSFGSFDTDDDVDYDYQSEEDEKLREYDLPDSDWQSMIGGSSSIVKEKNGIALVRHYDSASPASEDPNVFEIREKGGRVLWSSGITYMAEYIYEGIGPQQVFADSKKKAEKKFEEILKKRK